jgi:hypothetical protein
MKRLRTILTASFVIACIFLGIIFPISYHVRVASLDNQSKNWIQPNSIGFGTHFRVGFEDGGFWLYNGYHPWWGGTRYLCDEKGILYKGGHAHTVHDFVWHIGGDYGICQDSLIGEHGEFLDKERDCQLPGIYYCYFSPVDYPPPEWTLMISLWYPVSLFAILPGLWVYKRARFWINNHERKA